MSDEGWERGRYHIIIIQIMSNKILLIQRNITKKWKFYVIRKQHKHFQSFEIINQVYNIKDYIINVL